MTTKEQNLYFFYQRMTAMGFTLEEADTLRKAERTLQRWFELECGNGNNYASWAIERDEATDKPYMVRHHYAHGQGKDSITRTPIADREKGARKRIDKIMAAHPDYMSYVQGDPRGCALHIVAKKDVSEGESVDCVYTRGLAVCI